MDKKPETGVSKGFEILNRKPLDVFGVPLRRKEIAGALTPEFWYYNNIIERILKFGLPFPSWLDTPPWVLELYDLFTGVDEECENHSMNRYE